MVRPTDTIKAISHGSSLLRQAPINVRRLWTATGRISDYRLERVIIIIIIMPLIHLTALGANKNPPCYSIYCPLLFSQSSIVSSTTVLYHILLDLSRVPVLRLMSYIHPHFNSSLTSIFHSVRDSICHIRVDIQLESRIWVLYCITSPYLGTRYDLLS